MATCTITTENDADFYRQFQYMLIDGVTPIDITGNMLRMGIRYHAADATEVLLLTTENGGLAITDPVNGLFTVRITNVQLLQLPLGQYDHSLIRILPNAQQYRIWSGTLTVNPGASR